MTDEREKIMARLAKMKALADGGTGGERENAARLLEEVAAKYGIDLDRIGSETEKDHPLDGFKEGWRLDLVCQLLALMRIEKYGNPEGGRGHCCVFIHRVRDRKPGAHWRTEGLTARCTDAQFVELQAKFAVLSRDYERQKRAFNRAFLAANDLLTPYDPERAAKVTQEELDEALEARRLAVGIQRSALNKQLPPLRLAEGGEP